MKTLLMAAIAAATMVATPALAQDNRVRGSVTITVGSGHQPYYSPQRYYGNQGYNDRQRYYNERGHYNNQYRGRGHAYGHRYREQYSSFNEHYFDRLRDARFGCSPYDVAIRDPYSYGRVVCMPVQEFRAYRNRTWQ